MMDYSIEPRVTGCCWERPPETRSGCRGSTSAETVAQAVPRTAAPAFSVRAWHDQRRHRAHDHGGAGRAFLRRGPRELSALLQLAAAVLAAVPAGRLRLGDAAFRDPALERAFAARERRRVGGERRRDAERRLRRTGFRTRSSGGSSSGSPRRSLTATTGRLSGRSPSPRWRRLRW